MKINSKLVNLAKELKMNQDKAEALQTQLDSLKTTIENVNQELLGVMETEKVTKISVKEVGTCYIRSDIHVTTEDKGLLFKFLEANGAGELIKPTIAYQSLKAYTKEMLENEKRLPDGVEVFTKAKVVIRKN